MPLKWQQVRPQEHLKNNSIWLGKLRCSALKVEGWLPRSAVLLLRRQRIKFAQGNGRSRIAQRRQQATKDNIALRFHFPFPVGFCLPAELSTDRTDRIGGRSARVLFLNSTHILYLIWSTASAAASNHEGEGESWSDKNKYYELQ